MQPQKTNSFSILVTGIGGQGVLLISKVIAAAAAENGFFACRTESRGLSQRGGSVCSEVRFAGHELTPVMGTGEDLIIALDGLEALRVLAYRKLGGLLIANSAVTVPAHLTRRADFDEVKTSAFKNQITQELNSAVSSIALNFQMIVEPLNCSNSLNSVMIGAASAFIPLSLQSLQNALRTQVKIHTVEENILAFQAGSDAMQKYLLDSRTLAISA